MRHVVITLTRGALIASLLATAVAAQTPAAPASTSPSAKPPARQWTARTPDGQPDLQGIWTNAR
jgi:hypothetical protein